MKNIRFYFLALLLIMSIAISCEKAEESSSTELETDAFDSILAEELGADEYGMRSYVIAFLKAGPNRDQDSAATVELQKAHRANIRRLADEGKLVLAGPFLDGGDMSGLFVFNVATVEEARALTETDPAIQAGRLIMDLRPWYGSAALVSVHGIHKKIKK